MITAALILGALTLLVFVDDASPESGEQPSLVPVTVKRSNHFRS